jgi:mono/diheme cytochrome c family protein
MSDQRLQEVIREGGRGTRRSVLMPAWGNTLNEEQIRNLTAFIRTLTH